MTSEKRGLVSYWPIIGTTAVVCVVVVAAVAGTERTGTATAPKADDKLVTWTIKPPPAKLVLLKNRAISLAIAANDQPVKNIRLVHSTLQDDVSGALLGLDALQLCTKTTGPCSSAIDVEPRQTSVLFVRVMDTFAMDGTYKGSLALTADGKNGFDSFDLTVLSTSRRSQIAGSVLILVGVLVGWLVSGYLHQRAQRADALMPASILAEALPELFVHIQAAEHLVSNALPNTRRRVEGLQRELSPAALEDAGYVPGTIPSLRPARDLSTEYKQFLAGKALEVAVMKVIMKDGVATAVAKWDTANPKPGTAALGAFDQLAATANAVDATRIEVAKIVGLLNAALAPSPPSVSAAAAPAALPPPPTTAELRVEIRRLSLAVWLLWGLGTWLVGVMVLVATNYGFGVGLDYFKCLLWGLGVPVVGQQVQQLAPTTFSTAFNVTLPK